MNREFKIKLKVFAVMFFVSIAWFMIFAMLMVGISNGMVVDNLIKSGFIKYEIINDQPVKVLQDENLRPMLNDLGIFEVESKLDYYEK